MIHKRIVEAVLHCGSKSKQVVLVKRQGRDDFLIKHLVHEAADLVVFHAVADDVPSCQIGAERKAGMGSVQDAYFSLLVRTHIRNDKYLVRDSRFLERKPVVKAFRTFDNPDAEDFAHVDKLIRVAVLFFQSRHFLRIADTAGNNAVYQGSAENAFLIHIPAEILSQLPLVDILVDALKQFFSVVVNQLAGKNHDSLFACVEAGQQNLRQLGGEGRRRTVVSLAGRIILDACFRRIGDDHFQVIALRKLHQRFIIFFLVGIQAACNRRDDSLAVDFFPVLAAAQIQGVEPFLLIDQFRKSRGDRLDKNFLAVPYALLIGKIKPVIHERAEEIALSELHDFHRRILQDISLISRVLQHLIV